MGVMLYALFIIALYPSFGDMEAYNELVQNIPPAFQAFVGELGNLGTVGGYLANEHFTHMYLILLTILAVGFGNSIIGKEEDAGTLELVLARPVSRMAFVLQKVGAMYVVVFLIVLANWLGIAFGPYIVDVTVDNMDVLWASISGGLVALIFGNFSLFITAVKGNKGLASGLTIMIFIASYFLNTFAVFVDWLEPYQKFSIIKYYDVQEVLVHGVDYHNVLLLFLIGLLFVPLSLLFFNRRDIGV